MLWNRRGRRGNNIIEFTFLMPWYVFLFVGAYDFGFYAYSLISATTAARAAANYCAYSTTNSTGCTSGSGGTYNTACSYALNTLKYLPNVTSSLSVCSAAPVVVSATGPTTDSYGNSYAKVTLAYTTPQLIPIPGLLPGQITINRAITLIITGT